MLMALIATNGVHTAHVVFQHDWAAHGARINELSRILFTLKKDFTTVRSSLITQVMQCGHYSKLDMLGEKPMTPSPHVVFKLLLLDELPPSIPQDSIS
jgi:hypothetical protein